MGIYGQVLDQPELYVNTLAKTEAELGKYTNRITEALSLDANVTISRPVMENMNQVDIISVIFDSNLLTLTIFMCILSAQLIYSLML